MAKPTVLDLFCGAGGLSLGFEMAGFETLLGIDFDKYCCLTYASNFGDMGTRNEVQALRNKEFDEWLQKSDPSVTKVKHGDITRLGTSKLASIVGKGVDLVVGGPPCQGFSVAGRRDPNDPRNSLFMEFVRIVGQLTPKWFVMENVTGLLVMKTAKGKDVSRIIKDQFEKIGYVTENRVLLAADYGVPQKRKRVFFLGTNTGKRIVFPSPTHSQTPTMLIDGTSLKKWVPVRAALLKERDVPKRYFHGPKMIQGFIKRKERNVNNGKGFGWQILKPDEPSYTISARYWKDGSEALVMYSPSRIRMLTERECARIQSFPDSFCFSGPKKEVYRQIGNAVPPLLAKAIAETVRKSL